VAASHDPVGAGILRGEEFLSLEALTEASLRLASGLHARSIGQGDHVALLLRNDHAFFLAGLATAALGARTVPINWHGSAAEVQHVLVDSGAKLLIGHSDLLANVETGIPDSMPVFVVPTPDDIATAYELAVSNDGPTAGPSEELAAVVAGNPVWPTPLPGPVQPMIYTSGTTGRPKGVDRAPMGSVPSDALMEAMAGSMALYGFAPGMRTVINGPMYHTAIHGYAMSTLHMSGFAVLQPRFDPEEQLRWIEEFGITHLHMVPTMFVRLLQLPEAVRKKYDVSSLQHVIHDAAPCPVEVKQAMIDWWGPIIHECYGSTETGPLTGCSSEEWLSRPGTVGRPLPRAQVRVVAEDGSLCADNVQGEIYGWVDGFPPFEYRGSSSGGSAERRDGLVSVGDIGYLDPDGYLFVCDRKRDMIVSGGVNIYSAEVEACLLTHPHIEDCAVFGIPDEEFGESVAAAVQLRAELSEQEVIEHVRRHLARFKAPKVVTFHDDLPREDSGKIFKRKLRDPYWESSGRRI
jgi:long-chain acyl-CoA synthetase